MTASKENKKSQKLFGEENSGSINAKEKNKIYIKDGTADLLQMNLMKQQSNKLGSGSQKNNFDDMDIDNLSGDSPIKGRGGVKPEVDDEYDYDYDDKNMEDGLEELDPDALEYGGDDLLDEEEDYSKLQPTLAKKNIGGQLNFFNGLGDSDFFGGGGGGSKKKNFQRGNLSD